MSRRSPRPLPGEQVVIAHTPTGASAWLRASPALVSVRDVDRTRRDILRSDARLAAESRRLTAEIDRLRRAAQRALSKQSATRRDAFGRRTRAVSAGDAKLDVRFTTAVAALSHAQRDALHTLERVVDAQRSRMLFDDLVVVSAVLLFAAYGERAEPFATHNATLALSAGTWLLGDELMALFAADGSKQGIARERDVWSCIAPLGNLLTGWWLMRNRQHQRFVTGVAADFERAEVTPLGADALVETYRAIVPVLDLVAPDHAATFESLTEVAAVASITSLRFAANLARPPELLGLTARVAAGFLQIELRARTPRDPRAPETTPPPSIAALEVAWISDTREEP